ncbi:MAG: LacI family DNA-binding transcriptional regulator [Micropruina sp.]|uniref:LacI family DNA-binding transcriptional regulator n=1 Tax=Micropruina sp. TaxID=2737536 RepID=UPI0039E30484
MVTRKDVAARAGVSPSTVSYVISGNRPISPETRKRVQRVMQELKYTPNAIAQSLAGSRKGIIALHFPADHRGLNTTEFEYLTAVAQRAREHGYHALLWSDPVADVDALQTMVASQMVDGLILLEVFTQDPRIPMLRTSGAPFSLIGRPSDTDGLTWVDDDFDSLATQATDHLANLGHRDVLYLAPPLDDTERGHGAAVRTRVALETAAARRGLTLTRFHAARTTRGGLDAFAHLTSLSPRPTAVLAFNELAVSGLLRAAATTGVTIPGDLSVVALSHADVAAEMMTPPLTTVSPSATELAFRAVDALAELIAERDRAARGALVQPRLTIRASCGRAPA